MAELEPLQVGVMFWTGGELGIDARPADIAKMVAELGVQCGQIGIHGGADLGEASRQAWRQALADEGLTVVTAFPGFDGESYADIPAVKDTVGYVPAATRHAREERTREASDFAKALGIPGVATHIGFVPEDRAAPDYLAVRDLVRRVCDHCRDNGQTFALETGQEPAEALKAFIEDVDRPNLGVNFDPANMILYGSGEPLDALQVVQQWLLTVHCKDAKWPAVEGEWGAETPLGQGDVGMERFVAKLKDYGYSGPLTIEREIVGDAQRADIEQGVALLERLRAA
jgi:sugar phosphate isomerase/epimerase